MNKKHCAVVLGATGNMTYALANTLIGLRKHSPCLADDVFVYEKGISLNDKNIINKIMRTKFIEYNYSLHSDTNQGCIDRFTSLAFSRYECFNLLDEYKNVIWLDIDILIQKNIDEIIGFAQDTGIAALYGGCIISNFYKPIEGYNMQLPTCNSGVLVLNEKLPHYEKLCRWCYEETERLKDFLACQDQGIISLMFEKFDLTVNRLPHLYNYYPMFLKATFAFIQHPYGEEKFWNFFDETEWDENYNEWIELGGTPGEIQKLTLLEKIIFQKTDKYIERHEIKDEELFFNYLVRKYGDSEVQKAVTKVDELLKNGTIKSNR